MTDGLMQLVVYAMKLQCAWWDMRLFCLDRSTCKGCPYRKHTVCNKKTTEEIMEITTRIYKTFFDSK